MIFEILGHLLAAVVLTIGYRFVRYEGEEGLRFTRDNAIEVSYQVAIAFVILVILTLLIGYR
jgi:hypothetical protein